MKKHEILFVDEIRTDKLTAIAKTRANIIYNIEKIDARMAADFKTSIIDYQKAQYISGAYFIKAT